MTMNRHEPFEELISASLHGDLTLDERSRLDAHLDGCDQCRATLASFSDQRRIVAGLRHVAPPRDLGARVRTGIEGGSTAGLPWWRRPTAMFAGVGGALAVVAGAVVAVVLLNGSPDSPPVGDTSPTPSVAIQPSTTPQPTLPPQGSPPASEAPSVAPSIDASPTETPIPASPEPDLFLALTGPFDNLALTLRDGTTGATITELDTPGGEPIAAELSPDGNWLAYITPLGLSGMNEIRVTRLAQGADTFVLGEGIAGSPFLEHLSWSADGAYLAYTLADTAGAGTDVFAFTPSDGESHQVTNVGNAYAGSFVPGEDDASLLWVSTAADTPESYLLMLPDDADSIAAGDPEDLGFGAAHNVFQPLVSPNNAFVVYWTGRMERLGDEWLFSEAGTPWLAQNESDGASGYHFDVERPLFSDLTFDRDAFRSAAFTWGPDSDAFAVWSTDWTGTPEGAYPDRARVYFGHALDPRGLTSRHAIDAGDIPSDSLVVDVKVSPTGRHLVITAGRPRPGDLSAPAADLLMITRNTGEVADEVEVLGSADDGWFGPAAYDAVTETAAP